MENKFESLKGIVESSLKGKGKYSIKSKEEDNWLVMNVLIDMGFAKISSDKIIIDCELVDLMPSFESITRVRRKLNEQNKYLPSEKTREKRKKAEVEYRSNYSKKETYSSSGCMTNSQYGSW